MKPRLNAVRKNLSDASERVFHVERVQTRRIHIFRRIQARLDSESRLYYNNMLYGKFSECVRKFIHVKRYMLTKSLALKT